mmetsp:Transcript_11296/g.20728  ORF Transcript_11296/g.20728 Transcript_11296/m.20728 type:complete len:259 (+) Transcript_11296:128-904(+)
MTKRNHLVIILLHAILTASFGCIIQNSDSGVCTRKYLPQTSDLDAIEEARVRWMADIPFCGKWISSYFAPCVPSLPTKAWTAADPNFPDGRLTFSSDEQVDVHSIRSKDRWIEQTVTNTIQARIDLEKQQGSSHYHYFRNKDCQEAYARYTCWLNFPRCSDEFDESLPMCQSVCENLFRVCGFASDIWRCEADIVDGEDEDTRAFFPGQPFVRNEFQPKSNDPKAVCTPSIKGAASSRHGFSWAPLLLVNFVFIGFLR